MDMHELETIATRQKADRLFGPVDTLLSALTYESPVRTVAGYGAITFLIISDQPFTLRIEEAGAPGGPWAETSRHSSALDAASGNQFICLTIPPCGKYMRIFVDNTGADQAIFDLTVNGLPISGSAGAGGSGSQGATGIQGVTGPAGVGATGIQGVTGLSGSTGPQGETGIQGATGTGGSGSGLVLIERKVFVSDETSYVFSGLDGDNDETYFLKWRIINPASAHATYVVRPNSDSADLKQVTEYGIYGSTNPGGYTMADWWIGDLNSSTPGDITSGHMYIFAKSGNARTHEGQTADFETTIPIRRVYSGSYANTADNITSIEVLSTLANGIGTGSVIELYRLKG